MDPLVFLVGGVALLTYALHGFNGMLSRDLAVYSYAGQQVAEGVPPYLGILNRAGPLAHVIPGIGVGIARIGGFDDVFTMRLFFMVIATACVCAVYVLGRDVFASRLAGLVTAAAFLTFFGFIEYASNGPREKTPMTLFITLALWSVARRRWFTAGLFVSLATLCLQIAFFSSFAAVLAGVLFLAHGERLKALLRVAVGGAVPVAVLGVWFAIAGSLRESVDAFVLINFRYTTPDPVLPVLDEAWLDVTTAYGVSLWVLFAGLVALPLLSLGVLRKATRLANPWLPVVAAFTVGAAAGLAWNFKEYDAWPDLFPMLPFAAVGLGGVFHVAHQATAGAGRSRGRCCPLPGGDRPGHPPLGDQPRGPPRDPARIGQGGARAAARRRHDHLGRGAPGARPGQAQEPDPAPDVQLRPAVLHR